MSRRQWQLLGVALRGTLRFRLQTTLVALAAISGVAAVVASSAYAQSGARAILARYEALGTKMVVIAPAASRAVGGRARTGAAVTTLTLADYRAIRAARSDITAASASVTGSFRLRAGDLTKSVIVIACEPDYFAIKHWPAVQGAIFDSGAARDATRVVLLGRGASRDLFGDSDPTGRRLTINRVPFVVAGVMEERGRRLDGSDEDDQVYVPLAAGMHRLMNVDNLGAIMLQADTAASVQPLAAGAAALIATRHRRFGARLPDFQVTNQQQLMDDQLAAFGRFSFLVRWISLSALAVCAVGVTAICWISVNGRQADIGGMRALGARRGDIWLQFTAETLTPGLLGAACGLALGYGGALTLEAALGQPSWFDWTAAIVDALICTSLFAGVTGATSVRALQIPPAAAMAGA